MAEVTWINGTIDPPQSGEYYVTLGGDSAYTGGIIMTTKKRAMISQPMAGKSEEEIRETRERKTCARMVAKTVLWIV